MAKVGTKKALVASVGVVALCVLNTVIDGAQLALKHSEPLQHIVNIVGGGLPTWLYARPLFPGPVYIYRSYPGRAELQIWKLTQQGNSSEGKVVDLETGREGTVTFELRAGILAMTFASIDPGRPGVGSLVLKRVSANFAGDADLWVGGALGHQCECADGKAVTDHGKITLVRAVLSNRSKPTDEVRAKYLTGNEPIELPVGAAKLASK